MWDRRYQIANFRHLFNSTRACALEPRNYIYIYTPLYASVLLTLLNKQIYEERVINIMMIVVSLLANRFDEY